MNRYREQVLEAIRPIRVHSSTLFSWFGAPSPQLARSVRNALTAESARRYLALALRDQLYRDFYTQGFAQPTNRRRYDPPPSLTPFVEALAEANCGTGHWTHGWDVRQANEREILVHKNGLNVLVGLNDACEATGQPPIPGGVVSLRFPKDLPAISPGFYLAVGGNELRSQDSETIVRWYWNLSPAGAVSFMKKATFSLRGAGLSYRIKVLNDPSRFTRCDAVVLYHHKADTPQISEILATIYPELLSALNRRVPALTKPLAPGVALAEDPGGGDSFGLHRCGILADEIIRALEQGKRLPAEQLEAVDQGMVQLGISLDAPYLKPRSEDDYCFPLQAPVPSVSGALSLEPEAMDSDVFLRTAREIGQRLIDAAVWHEDFCNWMGSEPDPQHTTDDATRMIYKALGPDLYAGTSGAGLFLAQLYEVTGQSDARKSAIGAIRLALSRVDETPAPFRFGFYAGWAGIAYASARIGAILGEDELVDRARTLLQRLADEDTEGCEPDLLAGIAGSIVALTAVAEFLGKEFVLSFATRLGDVLLESAITTDEANCWKSATVRQQRGLTGLSHGAAGVGVAMLDLFNLTGARRYLDAMARAFEYERRLFDAEQANWPDLRTRAGYRRKQSAPAVFGASWCHGAPGIALARLRAFRALGTEQYGSEAYIALETTYRLIEANLHAEIGNYSLCHGLAGNADILLYGFEAGVRKDERYLEMVRRVARTGILKHARNGHRWPCGTKGETPGLMLGHAGIGYFYLRAAGRCLPSVLMPT